MKISRATRHLVWIIPTLILIIVIVTLLAVASDAKERFSQQTVLPVTPEFRLRLVAALTAENPRYNRDPEIWVKTKDFILRHAPASVKSKLPIELHPYVTADSHITSQGVQLIFQTDSAPALSKSRGFDPDRILNDNGYVSYRLAYGPGLYSRPIRLSTWNVVGVKGGMTLYGGLRFNCVPLTVEKLKLQVLSTADESTAKVTHEVELPNPVYQPVEPLPESPQYPPVAVVHDNVKVTIRGLASQAVMFTSTRESIRNGAAHVKLTRGGNDYTAVPSSAIPPGDAERGYSVLMVSSVQNLDPTASKWAMRQMDVFYGKDEIHYMGATRFSRQTEDNVIIHVMNGELALLPQPLKFSATLERESVFPPEEEQTVYFPLPRAGNGLDTSATVRLWDDTIGVQGVSYNTRSFNPTGVKLRMIKDKMLRFFYTSDKGIYPQQVALEGPNGKRLEFGVFTSEMEGETRYVQNQQMAAVDMTKERFSPETKLSAPVMMEDYTTVGLTFRSARRFGKTFDFILSPEPATGERTETP